jgi:hypothetical protein
MIARAIGGNREASARLSHAVSGATHVAGATTPFSPQLVRSWCARAARATRRPLTYAQARGCLRQAWNAWRLELRRNGYDPSRVGR